MAKNAPKTNALGMALDPSAFPEGRSDRRERPAADTAPREIQPQKENKTKRLYPLVRPSVAERFHAAAKAQGLSTNDLLNQLMEEYLDREGY